MSATEVSGGSYPRRPGMTWSGADRPAVTWRMPTPEQIQAGIDEDIRARREEIAMEWLAEQNFKSP